MPEQNPFCVRPNLNTISALVQNTRQTDKRRPTTPDYVIIILRETHRQQKRERERERARTEKRPTMKSITYLRPCKLLKFSLWLRWRQDTTTTTTSSQPARPVTWPPSFHLALALSLHARTRWCPYGLVILIKLDRPKPTHLSPVIIAKNGVSERSRALSQRLVWSVRARASRCSRYRLGRVA